jgi:tripartite ATP-independent transporter DctP family solute receptor
MKARLLLTSLLIGAGSLLFAQAGNAEPITIKFAHNSPVRMDAGFHRYFVHFSTLAEKYTHNKVKFQEFPASQMGSDAVAAKKLQLGLVQMMDLASNNLVKFYGGFDLFTLPFLIPSLKCGVDHVMTDPKLLHEISEGAQKKANIRVLAFETGGQRNMMNSKHPIMSPADLKGLRMRVAKNPILLATYKALGADVIGVAPAETYGALQTHMVDGNDGGVNWAYAQKLYEVQNYYSITAHQIVVTSVIINNDFWKTLPKDVQAGLSKAAKEAAVDNMHWIEGDQEKIYKIFKKAGLKFSNPDLAPFRKAVQPVWGEFAKHVGGWDRIKYVQSLTKACH